MSNQADLDKKARQAMIEFLKNDDDFIYRIVSNIDGYTEDDACAKFAEEKEFSVEEFVDALKFYEEEIIKNDDGSSEYPYRFLPDEQFSDRVLLVTFDKGDNIVSIENLEY